MMYMVEITESKADKLHSHVKEAYKHLDKICEFLEEMKEHHQDEDEYEDEEYYEEERKVPRKPSRSRQYETKPRRGIEGRYSSY